MPQIIERLSLIHSALEVLREHHLLIEAAAGYGKSVLLGQLVRYLPGAVYLRLTVDDNDVAVLQQRVREADAPTLLLDDAHLLATTSESAAWLQTKLVSSESRLVVAGRYLPFKPALLLAQGEAVRWDEAKLAFSAETSAKLLEDGRDAWAGEWHEKLGGWPLGIGLLRQLAPTQRGTAAIQSGLFDYLAQAVLNRLSDPLQTFMRVTAVALEFSAELAANLLDCAVDEALDHIQTIEQRNLFIGEGSRPQTYRYHDLFREFLLAQTPVTEQSQIAEEAVTYLTENDRYPLAIEQALDSGLHERAAALMLNIDWDYVHGTYRYRTFDRWVMTLDPAVRDANPALYWMAGQCLIYLPDREREAFTYFERSEALALEVEDWATVSVARYEHAHLRYMLDGGSTQLADDLAQIAREAPLDRNSGVRSLSTLSALQAELGRLREAQATWREAYRRAEQLGLSDMHLRMMKRQYALYMLIPLGAYAEARRLFADTIEYTADSPGKQLEVLTNYCDLLLPMGAWDELAATRARIDSLLATIDDVAVYIRVWLHFYDGMLALARNRPQQAEAHFRAMRREDEEGLELVCQRLGRIWLARQRGHLELIEGLLEQVALHRQSAPYHAAWAYLEADIARGLTSLASDETYTVSPEALSLYHYRARGDLLRLRALLTVLCYHQQQPRWQRFAHIVLREIRRPHYPELLTQRDPELGAHFWCVLFAERLAVEQATEALVDCGIIEPLLPLLPHPSAQIRQQTARVLGRIGDEQAMDALNEAISDEKDRPTKIVLEEALTTLEAQLAPPLQIQLMGGFTVRRGREVIDDYHRPIVARLLQFFAVHRARPLSRDYILDALWPGTDPEKAWRTFRSVYSRLRNTLEPYMRRKGPNRYFSLDGDSYTFDPQGHVSVDAEQFRQQLRADLPTDQLSALLHDYGPVLPELPHVDWLIDLREQMQELYLDGCLRLGQQLLAQGEAAEAQRWAQRVIAAAPWMEAAYQLLMRAYARQNQRSRALHIYAEARAALQAELAVKPSPLTEWLYTRLQAGETI